MVLFTFQQSCQTANTQFNYYFIINILHIRNASTAAGNQIPDPSHGLSTRYSEAEKQEKNSKAASCAGKIQNVLRVAQRKKKKKMKKN